jgi:nucleoid-associated protein YgaU
MIGRAGVWAPVAASGGALICAVAVAGWHFASTPRGGLPEILNTPVNSAPVSASAEPQAPAPSQPPPAPVASFGPRVDVARIMPNGDVVVAGRAERGAKVALLDGGEVLMETQADPGSGEFVFLPPRLGPGAHNLSLRSATASDGTHPMESPVQAFSIAPQIKTSPSASATPSSPAASQPEPDAPARTEHGGKTTIARGDTLWRISRDKLGRGALYPTIVQANSPKIRNPDLIYPHQTLVIP